MIHFAVALISYLCFISLYFLPDNIRFAFFGVFIVATIRFFFEHGKRKGNYRINKEQFSKMDVIFLNEEEDFLTSLPEYKMLLFESDLSSTVMFFSNDKKLIKKIKKVKGKMTIYYVGNFIFFAERMDEKKE